MWILHKEISNNHYANEIIIDVSNFSNGIYFLISGNKTIRFVVLHQ